MAFKTDCGGVALTADIKLSKKATTWNTRLSQIGRTDSNITIVTYSLVDMNYIGQILSKRPNGKGITLISHISYLENAQKLKATFPKMKVFVNSESHAKLVLVAPETVWISSEDIGRKLKSFNTTVGIKNKFAYDHYYLQVLNLLQSKETLEIQEA